MSKSRSVARLIRLPVPNIPRYGANAQRRAANAPVVAYLRQSVSRTRSVDFLEELEMQNAELRHRAVELALEVQALREEITP
jgi:hypothetical protein